MEWLIAGALLHSFFVVGLSGVVIIRYLLSPRKWHTVGMAFSYIVLTLNNVYGVTVGFYVPGSPRFIASVVAWIIGDACLLFLLGRASSEMDKHRER